MSQSASIHPTDIKHFVPETPIGAGDSTKTKNMPAFLELICYWREAEDKQGK